MKRDLTGDPRSCPAPGAPHPPTPGLTPLLSARPLAQTAGPKSRGAADGVLWTAHPDPSGGGDRAQGKEGGRHRQEANGAGCSGCPRDRWSAGPWLLAPAGRRSRRARKGLGSAGLRLVREKGKAQSAWWEVTGTRASLRFLGPVQRFRLALGFSLHGRPSPALVWAELGTRAPRSNHVLMSGTSKYLGPACFFWWCQSPFLVPYMNPELIRYRNGVGVGVGWVQRVPPHPRPCTELVTLAHP